MHENFEESKARDLPHLTLMGNFDLNYEGQCMLVAPAGQRLLSLLALSRRSLTREYTAEKLWPEAPGVRAAGRLRSTLWRLPKLDRPLVVATASTLHLSRDVETDLTATEDVLRRTIAWAERPAQHHPPEAPQPGITLADEALSSDLLPEAWDEWVVIERERLHQMRLLALESLAHAHRSAGNFGQALDAGMRAVAGEPLRESAHRQVIETYLAQGNTREAIRHFEELRRLFRTELQLQPSPQLCRRMADAVEGRHTRP